MRDQERYKAALRRLRATWGPGWEHLTADHREALLAREAVYLLLGQCESLTKFTEAKQLVLAVMGWPALKVTP